MLSLAESFWQEDCGYGRKSSKLSLLSCYKHIQFTPWLQHICKHILCSPSTPRFSRAILCMLSCFVSLEGSELHISLPGVLQKVIERSSWLGDHSLQTDKNFSHWTVVHQMAKHPRSGKKQSPLGHSLSWSIVGRRKHMFGDIYNWPRNVTIQNPVSTSKCSLLRTPCN